MLQLDPENSKALFRQGVAQRYCGHLEAARESMTLAAKADPKSREIRVQLKEVKALLKQQVEQGEQTLSWGRGADEAATVAPEVESTQKPSMYNNWDAPRVGKELPPPEGVAEVPKKIDKWDGLVWKDISNFYFTDDAPFSIVKVGVPLPNVHKIPAEDIRFKVTERACELHVRDMNSVNYRLRLDPLWSYVVPSESNIRVKSNKLLIKLTKKDMNHSGPWQKLQVT